MVFSRFSLGSGSPRRPHARKRRGGPTVCWARCWVLFPGRPTESSPWLCDAHVIAPVFRRCRFRSRGSEQPGGLPGVTQLLSAVGSQPSMGPARGPPQRREDTLQPGLWEPMCRDRWVDALQRVLESLARMHHGKGGGGGGSAPWRGPSGEEVGDSR